MKDERQYQSLEKAFICVNKNKMYVLKAAILKDIECEYCLVGATGKSYGNSKELETMNYKEAKRTMVLRSTYGRTCSSHVQKSLFK